MELEPWIGTLFDRVQPVSGSRERAILYLKSRLEDLDPYWFTEAAIAGIWMNLRSLNSADRVRKALKDYHAKQAPPRPPPVSEQEREADRWDKRQAELRQDWDDPAGIMRRVASCNGNVPLLRLLAGLVARWAPQHLGYLPPHILEAVAEDSTLPALVELRRTDEAIASMRVARVHVEQQAQRLDEAVAHTVGPRYLDAATLDRINPLPNGRKRTDATPGLRPASTSASVDPDTPTETADASADADRS